MEEINQGMLYIGNRIIDPIMEESEERPIPIPSIVIALTQLARILIEEYRDRFSELEKLMIKKSIILLQEEARKI